MAKQNLSTAAAFTRLLNRPDQWRRTGRPMPQRLDFLYKLKKGINVTIDTQEKILLESGYTTQKVTTWQEP